MKESFAPERNVHERMNVGLDESAVGKVNLGKVLPATVIGS